MKNSKNPCGCDGRVERPEVGIGPYGDTTSLEMELRDSHLPEAAFGDPDLLGGLVGTRLTPIEPFGDPDLGSATTNAPFVASGISPPDLIESNQIASPTFTANQDSLGSLLEVLRAHPGLKITLSLE